MRWSCAESAFLVGPKKAFVASFYQHIHGQFFYSGGSVCTFVALGVLGHLCGVVGWEDSTGASSHVVTLVPVILWLDLHQQRIIHLQLQLVVMSGDKPVETDVVMWAIEGTSRAFDAVDGWLTLCTQHKHVSGCTSALIFGSFQGNTLTSLMPASQMWC